MSEKNLIEKLRQEIVVLERHLKILKIIVDDGPIGIIKLSEITKYPAHKVRYSLRVLENHNLIVPSSNGAKTTNETTRFINEFKNILGDMKTRLSELDRCF